MATSKSRVKLDASQVVAFERRLTLAAQLIEEEGEEFEEMWGEKWAEEMRATVPYGEGDEKYGHLRDNIEQVEPGGITFGQAYWWRFVDRGTVNMPPQPFVKPAMKRIRTPARKDAGVRVVNLIARGR